VLGVEPRLFWCCCCKDVDVDDDDDWDEAGCCDCCNWGCCCVWNGPGENSSGECVPVNGAESCSTDRCC